jgi:hypothetical protein
VTKIILRLVSIGVTFLAATVQARGDSVVFSLIEPATLLSEMLGQEGKIGDVNLKPTPSAGLWMMTVCRPVDFCDGSSLQASSETRLASTDYMCYSGSLEQRARALYILAANTKASKTMVEDEVEEDVGISASDFWCERR